MGKLKKELICLSIWKIDKQGTGILENLGKKVYMEKTQLQKCKKPALEKLNVYEDGLDLLLG
jgi:hypothetical protein